MMMKNHTMMKEDMKMSGGMHEGMVGMPMNMNGSHSMMKMWFHTGLNDYLLFKPWLITNVTEMIFACLGVFILAALYEGLKILREYLLTRSAKVAKRHIYQRANGDVGSGNDEEVHVRRSVISRWNILSAAHILQTFLHMLQVLLSYFLMLIFMTYNIWLCMAVILGAGAGYFAFSWKRTVLLEDLTEHCH